MQSESISGGNRKLLIIKLDPFVTFVFLVHCALFLKIFQGGDRTIYSPAKMDFTNSTPTNVPQTTPRPRTSVRRNLIQDFENELPTPVVTNSPPVQEIFANRENCTEVEHESSWYSGLMYWTCGISALVLTVLSVFRYSPQKLLLRLTHEALGNISIIFLGIIVCAILWKLYQSTMRRTARIPNMMRNTLTGRTSDQDTASYNEEVGLTGSGLNLHVKRTFKGEGTEVWSEFVRYFENVATLNNWSIDMRRKIGRAHV